LRLPRGRDLAAPKEIVDLVEKFEHNLLEYKTSTYNETQARQEFINPFFKALGWDVYNEQGFSGAYKEVIHEASLKVGNTTKAPDYAFKIGEGMKFLVEAKKPHVNLLRSHPTPAYQLRAYACSLELPISILTNFEEFAVYDCRSIPKKTDNADTARICYLRYTEYIDCWDWISSKFSKTAIQRGYLNKFLQENRDGKRTETIDNTAFQEEIISRWKEELKSYPPKQIS
jgi:predicted type IV restriction endonuclease